MKSKRCNQDQSSLSFLAPEGSSGTRAAPPPTRALAAPGQRTRCANLRPIFVELPSTGSLRRAPTLTIHRLLLKMDKIQVTNSMYASHSRFFFSLFSILNWQFGANNHNGAASWRHHRKRAQVGLQHQLRWNCSSRLVGFFADYHSTARLVGG